VKREQVTITRKGGDTGGKSHKKFGVVRNGHITGGGTKKTGQTGGVSAQELEKKNLRKYRKTVQKWRWEGIEILMSRGGGNPWGLTFFSFSCNEQGGGGTTKYADSLG